MCFLGIRKGECSDSEPGEIDGGRERRAGEWGEGRSQGPELSEACFWSCSWLGHSSRGRMDEAEVEAAAWPFLFAPIPSL